MLTTSLCSYYSFPARAAPTSKPRDSIDDEASGRLRYCISHGPRQDSLSQPQPTQEPQFVVPNRVLSKAVQRHRSSERAKVAQHYRSFVDGALSDVYAAHQSAHVNKARRSNLKCKRELERTTVSGRRRGRENLDAGVFGNFGQERKGQIYGYNPPGGQKRE